MKVLDTLPDDVKEDSRWLVLRMDGTVMHGEYSTAQHAVVAENRVPVDLYTDSNDWSPATGYIAIDDVPDIKYSEWLNGRTARIPASYKAGYCLGSSDAWNFLIKQRNLDGAVVIDEAHELNVDADKLRATIDEYHKANGAGDDNV